MEKSYYDGLIDAFEEETKLANEAYESEREERKKTRIRNLKIRKNRTNQLLRKGLTGIVLTAGFVGLVVSNNNPVNKVTNELLADAGLSFTDNAKTVDSKMTNEELAAYIDDYNVTLEQVNEAVANDLKWNMLYSEKNMEKVERLNSEAFEELRENSKGVR